jgi:hypothetical protein
MWPHLCSLRASSAWHAMQCGCLCPFFFGFCVSWKWLLFVLFVLWLDVSLLGVTEVTNGHGIKWSEKVKIIQEMEFFFQLLLSVESGYRLSPRQTVNQGFTVFNNVQYWGYTALKLYYNTSNETKQNNNQTEQQIVILFIWMLGLVSILEVMLLEKGLVKV